MPTLKKPGQSREPRSMEEYMVAWMEEEDGCVKEGQAVFPPPESCAKATHIMYTVAEFHMLTILLVVIFLGMLFGLTMAALKT